MASVSLGSGDVHVPATIGTLPFGSSAMAYPKPPQHQIPPHQSFFLQKRGVQSVYGSDTAQPPAPLTTRPFTKTNPKFPQTVPPPLTFAGTSVQQSSMQDVVVGSPKREFFSQKRQSDQNERDERDAQQGHRRAEGKEFSTRSKQGTPGLTTLRHSDVVQAQNAQLTAQNTAPQPDAYTTTDAQRRPTTTVGRPNPYERILRFQGPLKSTSHDHFKSPKDEVKKSIEDNGKWGQATGYMGHIPRDPKTRTRLKGVEDGLRTHTKDHLLLTSSLNLPGYTGHSPAAVTNDRGVAMRPDLTRTTAGGDMKYAAEHPDRAQTSREHAKSHAMKSFFSRGHTGEDLAATECYYATFRPYAGFMKHGSKGEQGWLAATAR